MSTEHAAGCLCRDCAGTTLPQLDRDRLRELTPAQVEQARRNGQLDGLMAAATEVPPSRQDDATPPAGQHSRAEVQAMTAAAIEEARRAGRLAWLMGQPV